MKLTEMDLPAPLGQEEIAGWIPMPELFPMQSNSQSIGTIKGVPENDGDDIKSFGSVNNDSTSKWAVECNHLTLSLQIFRCKYKT